MIIMAERIWIEEEGEIQAAFSLCSNQWLMPGVLILVLWDHPWADHTVLCPVIRGAGAGDGPCIKMPEITFPNLPTLTSGASIPDPAPGLGGDTCPDSVYISCLPLDASFDKISFQRSLIDCLSMTLFPASINFYICYLFIPTIIRQRNIILNSPWGVSYSFQCFQSQESWIFDILMLCSAHITWYPHPTQHGAVISLSRGWR